MVFEGATQTLGDIIDSQTKVFTPNNTGNKILTLNDSDFAFPGSQMNASQEESEIGQFSSPPKDDIVDFSPSP